MKNKKRIKKYLKFSALILTLFLLWGGNKIWEIYQTANPNWKYTEIKIEKKNLQKSYQVDGEIEAEYEISLASEIPGILSQIYVKEGEVIKKWKLLAKLKDTDYRNQISSALLNQKISETLLEKTKNPNQNLNLDRAVLIDQQKIIKNKIKLNKIAQEKIINSLEVFLSQILRMEIDDFFTHTEFDGSYYQKSIFTYRLTSDSKIDYLENARYELGKKFIDFKKSNKNLDITQKTLTAFEKMLYDLYKSSRNILGFSEKEVEQLEKNLSYWQDQVINKKNQLTELKIQLEQLNKELDVQTKILGKLDNLINPWDLKLAEKKIEQAKVKKQNATTQLQKTFLRAPKDGIVAKIYLKEGEYAGPAQPIIKIISKNKYYKIKIPEVYLGNIKIGMPVEIKLNAFKNKIFKGKIEIIYPEKIEDFGIVYYEAKVSFAKKDLAEFNILPGMQGEAKIIYSQKNNVWALPAEVIKKDNDKYFIYTLAENNAWDEPKFLKQKIEIDFKGDNFIEVKNKKNFNGIKILKIEK